MISKKMYTLKLLGKESKTVIINILNILKQNLVIMREHLGNMSSKTETEKGKKKIL